MKVYKPTDKLNFGKYSGEDVRFVFTFEPSYIEWLILNNDYFVIDIKDFESLHTFPMDISGITSGERFGFVNVKVQGEAEPRIVTLKEYITEFFPKEYTENYLNTPATIRKFQFSNKAITKLNQKWSLMR